MYSAIASNGFILGLPSSWFDFSFGIHPLSTQWKSMYYLCFLHIIFFQALEYLIAWTRVGIIHCMVLFAPNLILIYL